MSGGAILTTKALSVARGGETIVSGVDLELAPGDAIILRGANGTGKSTLLRALAGLITPSAGSASVKKPVSEASFELQKAVSYFGHENGLKAAMTARETLEFWQRLEAAPPPLVERAILALNLGAFIGKRTGELSAGQKRRLGLARLVIEARPIWLLDEPTGAMDTHHVELTTHLIETHCENGGSAIVATHDAIDIIGARRLTLASAEDAIA